MKNYIIPVKYVVMTNYINAAILWGYRPYQSQDYAPWCQAVSELITLLVIFNLASWRTILHACMVTNIWSTDFISWADERGIDIACDMHCTVI